MWKELHILNEDIPILIKHQIRVCLDNPSIGDRLPRRIWIAVHSVDDWNKLRDTLTDSEIRISSFAPGFQDNI